MYELKTFKIADNNAVLDFVNDKRVKVHFIAANDILFFVFYEQL